LKCGSQSYKTSRRAVLFDRPSICAQHRIVANENDGVRNSFPLGGMAAISAGPAAVFYDGNDSDGVIRDAAFRTRSTVVKQMPVDEFRLASVFVFLERPDLEQWLTELRNRDSSVDIWLILGPESSPMTAAAIDTKLERRQVLAKLGPKRIASLINRYRLRGWISRDVNVVLAAIHTGIQNRDSRIGYVKSRRELGTRNRQLYDLQENLEKIVTERTSYLSDAERELHRRTQATRELVRFIKELSQAEAIEEVLQFLSNEVRSFHEVRPPMLALVSPEFGARLHFQQVRAGGGQRAHEKGWGSKTVSRPWPSRSAIRINEAEDQTYLAQELGRPIARTVVFPLGKDARVSASPLLIFEHSFDELKADRFKKFLIPRLEPLSTALDRVVINRELIAASRLWESTFDGISDPIAVVGTNYEVLRMNQAFARHQSRNEDTRKTKCYEIFAARSAPCDGCGFSQADKTPEHIEWQVRRGANVYDVSGYPIRFQEEAKVKTLIHHYSDVTKSLELKGHAFQGEKMAAIGLMAGNIAHELNNPLAGLKSLAQVLRQEAKYPESVKNDLHEIENAAERSSAIIRDLMEFSNAEDRARETISLNQIADSALNMVKTALHDHRVETDWGDNQEVMVNVDPHLLQHVVFNIVNNACQAMKEPGEISIRTYRQTLPEGEHAILEISDTGPGIPSEILSRVFEPFFTTKGAGQGTGLGLSMSRWVVETYRGRIEVENRKDLTGAVFRILLPLAPRGGT
jgi:two-component system NtrC family sensor kinase